MYVSGVARPRNLVGHKDGKWLFAALLLEQSWLGLALLGPPLATPLMDVHWINITNGHINMYK